MEASDAFDPQGSVDDEDPFADSEFEDGGEWDGDPNPATTAEEPAPATVAQTPPAAVALGPEPAPDIPVVNAEGERVEPAGQAEPVAERQPDPEPAAVPETPPAAASAPEPPEEPTPKPPAAAESPAAEPQPEPQPEPEPQSGGGEPVASGEAAEPGDAEPPAETKDDKGRTAFRNYVVLMVEGNGRFRQLAWYEDKTGRMVSRTTPGAKRQTFASSRDAAGALGIGFAALGEPEDGTPLVAIAASHFQIKKVWPKDEKIQPRRRLNIS